MASFITFQGRRVSSSWFEIFQGALREGKKVPLNDGARTVAIQNERIRKHGRWSPSNPHGAAPAVPGAPHIKDGAQNHAVDINQPDGGLFVWLRAHGVPVVRNVGPEAWHYDPTDLKAFLRAAGKMHKHRLRLIKYRTKATELEANIEARHRRGKASPGQRLLNARYNRLIRKLRGRAY